MDKRIKRIKERSEYPEERIEKTMSMSYDGDQFLVRIPKIISDFFDCEKGDKIKFIVNVPYCMETRQKVMVAEVVDE